MSALTNIEGGPAAAPGTVIADAVPVRGHELLETLRGKLGWIALAAGAVVVAVAMRQPGPWAGDWTVDARLASDEIREQLADRGVPIPGLPFGAFGPSAVRKAMSLDRIGIRIEEDGTWSGTFDSGGGVLSEGTWVADGHRITFTRTAPPGPPTVGIRDGRILRVGVTAPLGLRLDVPLSR